MATGNHLLVQLKGNQPTLQETIRAYCAQHPPDDQHYQCDLGQRSRLEQRTVRFWRLPSGVGVESWHAPFRAVVEVTRQTECFNTIRKDWVPRQEQPACYLCTHTDSAQVLGQVIRAHWGIENHLHHVLDTALEEDACRIRRNPGVFALIRHFALNLLRFNGQTNIKAALYNNALSLDRLLAYQGI